MSSHSESLRQDANSMSSCSISSFTSSLSPKNSFPTSRERPLKNAASYSSLPIERGLPTHLIANQLSTPSLPLFRYHSPRSTVFQVRRLSRSSTGAALSGSFALPTSTKGTNGRLLAQKRRKPATILVASYLSTNSSSPDRFIPRRRSSNGLIKSFKANKSLEKLSGTERLLRNDAANYSPFSTRRTSANQRRIRNEAQRRPTVVTPRGSSRRGPLRTRTAGSSGNRNSTASAATQLGPVPAIPDGRGRLFRSGTNAPLFYANFFPQEPHEDIKDRFEHRLAAALDIDRSARIVRAVFPEITRNVDDSRPRAILAERWWDGGRWAQSHAQTTPVLDAPRMRDDFYCSILAFCATTRTLAVGLGNKVYLWSEEIGVVPLQRPMDEEQDCYVGSLSFSSGADGHSILAIGRSNGILSLWGFEEDGDRITCRYPHGITCVSFKPVGTFRKCVESGDSISTEELLVGDEKGRVFYYSIQWEAEATNTQSKGNITLLARIEIHSQQICGIEWSPDGGLFATGGNDNLCLLFDAADMPDDFTPRRTTWPLGPVHQHYRNHIRGVLPTTRAASLIDGYARSTSSNMLASTGRLSLAGSAHTTDGVRIVTAGYERQRWVHAAAIKAIAFCPWQRGLVAVGGGCNDRGIHFYHVWSGACLATINVLAQVTSLIWSKTRREIVATLGYCQPEHPFRIAVYSWPDCAQILAIPWHSDSRALYAIPYPGGPNDPRIQRSGEGEPWWKRTAEEGSIVVASSDESIKFHEVWSEKARTARVGRGGFGWSDILEGLEGAEKDGGIIR